MFLHLSVILFTEGRCTSLGQTPSRADTLHPPLINLPTLDYSMGYRKDLALLVGKAQGIQPLQHIVKRRHVGLPLPALLVQNQISRLGPFGDSYGLF